MHCLLRPHASPLAFFTCNTTRTNHHNHPDEPIQNRRVLKFVSVKKKDLWIGVVRRESPGYNLDDGVTAYYPRCGVVTDLDLIWVLQT
jgi:hypothetical protein